MNTKLVLASAGTGKTHHLEHELLNAVAAGTPPQRVLAVTFTNRAAAELLSRGRQRLLLEGHQEAARELALARIGTVNAVFGCLVAEHALEQGRSPAASVIPEAMQERLLRVAADGAFACHATRLNELARRFGFDEGRSPGRDWREMVGDIVAVARANGIAPGELGRSARRSWQALRGILGQPRPGSAAQLDATLATAVDAALAALGGGDNTKTTAAAMETLEEAQHLLRRGDASWSLWARLSKLTAAKNSQRLLAPVNAAALAHEHHPRLRRELLEFVARIFACAARAMAEAQEFRRDLGLMDFVDQEAEALALLAQPGVSQRVGGEIAKMLVDEFQDTSPLQLALFLRLAPHVGELVCVGDRKQSIYGFRGADPELVRAAGALLPPAQVLDVNRRSRPALVEFANAVFGTAMPTIGIPRTETVVQAFRQDAPGQPAALHLWRVHAANNAKAASALAAQVARILENPAGWPVADRGAEATRPIRGGDIAVLARKNTQAEEIARAICDAGLKVALARGGLLRRAEVAIALAGLRVLADGRDRFAMAEIAHFLEGGTDAPLWLADALAHSASAGQPHPLERHPAVQALAEARGRLAALSPAEALDLAIEVLDLPALMQRWGDAASRHAQLQALRELANTYEQECLDERRPATHAGLAAWLAALPDAEQPPSPDPDAVRVLTVHKAKGLEWPMVVCADCDWDGEARLFDDPAAMPRDGAFDPQDPLSGRWVRFWPWPYGAQEAGVRLREDALASPLGQEVQRRCDEEAVRLVYVALTRARDYLVLAPRVTTTQKNGAVLKPGWLCALPQGALDLPLQGSTLLVGGQTVAAEALELAPPETPSPAAPSGWLPDLPPGAPPEFPTRRLSPSAAAAEQDAAFGVIRLGPRLALPGTPDMERVGEAIHAFMAADRPDADRAWRIGLGERLAASWGTPELDPSDIVRAADRFWAHIRQEYPDATLRRECPVTLVDGGQVISGRVDLVVEHADGLAVYDHKAFPGGSEVWPKRVALHAPQLVAYALALEAATGRQVTRLALHLPVAGVVLVVRGGDGSEGVELELEDAGPT